MNTEVEKSDAQIPLLTEDDSQVLGNVKAQAPAKSNVVKLFYLIGVLLGLVCVVASLSWWQHNRNAKKAEQTAQEPPKQAKPAYMEKNEAIGDTGITAVQAEIKKKQDEEALANAIAAANAANAARSNPQPTGYPQQANATYTAAGASAPVVTATPIARKMSGDVMIALNATESNSVTAAQPMQPASIPMQDGRTAPVSLMPANFTPPPTGGSQSESPIAAKLKPTILQGGSAGKLPSLDFLLKKGTVIPCALKTGINTTLPGFVTCSVTNDVYSASNKLLLIERGATIFGEQQSSVIQGQARVFVLWTRIDNPNGTFAQLDSPATDAMGFNGVGGFVDNHFQERFGGAILISMIRDFSQYLARTVAPPAPGQMGYQNTTDTAASMGQEVLRNTINIPPHIIINPATVVNVLVARDVSFDSVYKVMR